MTNKKATTSALIKVDENSHIPLNSIWWISNQMAFCLLRLIHIYYGAHWCTLYSSPFPLSLSLIIIYLSVGLINKCHCFVFQRQLSVWHATQKYFIQIVNKTKRSSHVNKKAHTTLVNNKQQAINMRAHQLNHLPIKCILNILNFVSCSEINKTIPFVCIFKCNPSNLLVLCVSIRLFVSSVSILEFPLGNRAHIIPCYLPIYRLHYLNWCF